VKRHLLIALAVLTLILPGLVLSAGCPAPSPDSGTRAAIVDQLAILEPNQAFLVQMTAELEACGFEVDVYQGEEVNVKLYRELPKYGYKLIIFRAHAGLLKGEENSEVVGVKSETYLFTAETYKQTKYVREQLEDQLLPAEMTADFPLVFAVNSKFVLESMEERFDNTVMIMMGCSCIYLEDMAAAFTLKGASTYLGWDGSVGLGYVDRATADLITNLCTERMTVERAVTETMAGIGTDPEWGAELKYYPRESGGKTIGELIGTIAGE
jgi:hypothetical protein